MNQRLSIQYVYMDDICQFALQTLRDRSPVGSAGDPHPGLYRDGHMLFIDGHNVPDAKNWKPGQQIDISNPEPYARIIELGNGRMRAPLNVYQQSAPIIAARYGNSVIVQFVFMPVQFGSMQAYANSAAGRAARTRRGGSTIKARRDWLSRQPAIQINQR